MMEKFRLDGQTALVTGGSRGIGLGIALAMAEAGADIVLAARDAATLEQARRGLATTGRNIRVTPFDMRRVEDIPAFYERIAVETGGIDLLVNNAGGIVRGAAETISPQDLQSILELNLSAVFALSQAFARAHIQSATPGKIINVSSVMAETARSGAAAYAMTKGGIRQLTKALAVEWAPHRIHVNAIGPGFTRTDLTRALWSDPAFAQTVARRTPLGRWGTPEDIGAAAVFLAAPASDYITGQTLYVDGGLISSMGGLE
ncbi:MAG: glucose 1-dehydrogenase [Deltaproteobacteria bacterium]|nr:glucose 1-dehydrogenase [Deltaproteobacteria bacterium]